VLKFPPKPWVKKIMPWCIFLSLVSVIGSQSRGAVLAILAVGAFYWLKSRNKAFTAMIFIFLATFAFLFMPESWHERVSSIGSYQQDASAMGRIRAWEYSIAVANDRLTGGGFLSWGLEHYNRYGIYVDQAFVAHSIYFSVLNDGGWPGLIIFLLILFQIWRQLSRVISLTESMPDYAEYNFLAKMLQISMLAFMAGGSFLSLSYFDLAWHFMAITIALTYLAKDISPREKVLSGRARPRAKVAGSQTKPRLTRRA
jgi:putative inorganic carbon (HCO3(-)) transporter